MESTERRRVIKRWLVLLLLVEMTCASYLAVRLYHLHESLEELREQKRRRDKSDRVKTVKPSQPTEFLYLQQQAQEQAGGSRSMAAQAHWNLATPGLLDLNTQQTELLDEEITAEDINLAVFHLQQAADLGHPQAQVVVAQALEAGFWPTIIQPTIDPLQRLSQNRTSTHQGALYLQMAAMAGDADALQMLAHRSFRRKGQCNETLPYMEAAADLIIDQLEADPQSRAKVTPASDKHLLHQIWTHGGTPSKLDANNKPDETSSFLEFYKIRVTDNNSPRAAFALANFYHYGVRGVPQNMTLALSYYETAARLNHWEAAGLAGRMYFWGIGVPQDLHKAYKMFRLGIPLTLDGCRERHQEKMRQSKTDTEVVHECDPGCLNGMGLLRLFGLPMIAAVDLHLAEEYFKLAKDQGNLDAAYHLAMMRLGWKTHYKLLDDVVKDEGSSSIAEDLFSMTDSKRHLSQGEFQSILSDLNAAASKGSLQARHRLAKMHTYGYRVPVREQMVQVTTQDCDKALKHYKWILDNASPQRAKRLRRAFKQYTAGQLADSLRNYLVASELGSESAQVNAAFLLEQGECLGMDPIACMQGSARLLKAASKRGDTEASLRVGDMYYYGKLRTGDLTPVGPLEHIRNVLYPIALASRVVGKLKDALISTVSGNATNNEQSTSIVEGSVDKDAQLRGDLQIASRYYRTAAETSQSPRANFNLGYMYEWGLGVPQDFHLAKRHYDLAVSGPSKQGEVPVAIALYGLHVHKFLAKYSLAIASFVGEYRFFLTERQITEIIREGGLGAGSRDDKVFQLSMMHVFSLESLIFFVVLTLFFARLLSRYYSLQ